METSTHPFLFSAGSWLGEGKIKLSMVTEELPFYTRWRIDEDAKADGFAGWLQEIQIQGVADTMINSFSFSNKSEEEFALLLENHALGRVKGKGVFSEKVIAWELQAKEIGFQGFEIYEKQADGSYIFYAEYATDDDYRTTIQGKIWQKTSA